MCISDKTEICPFVHIIIILLIIHNIIIIIKTRGSELRGQKAQSACPQNNKHATTTVSHLHEGSITQSFKIRMAKSQPY